MIDLIDRCSWAVIVLLVCLSQAITLFAAYAYLERMEAHFIACDFVGKERKRLGNSPFGRIKRVRQLAALTGRVSYPLMLERHAVMPAERFPKNLEQWLSVPRRLMRIAWTGAVLLGLWLAVARLTTVLSTPASDLQLLCLAGLIACGAIAVAALFVRTWVSFFKLAEIESFLEQSYFVGRNRRVLGDSVYGRACRLYHIAFVVLLDDDFLQQSDPDAIAGINDLPLRLRRWLIIPARLFGYSCAGFVAICSVAMILRVFA